MIIPITGNIFKIIFVRSFLQGTIRSFLVKYQQRIDILVDTSFKAWGWRYIPQAVVFICVIIILGENTMTEDINGLLQKVSNTERANGLMSTFQNMPKEEQLPLLEWARSICIRLASYIEKQGVIEATGSSDHVDLPVPKIYVELALRVGIIRALSTNNTELLTGCEHAYRHVMGDNKAKALDDFKQVVTLSLQVAKW